MQMSAFDAFEPHARALVENPPREVQVLGQKLAPMIGLFEGLNKYMHDLLEKALTRRDFADRFCERLALLNRLVHVLYFDMLCDEHAVFLEVVDLRFDHPASGCMLIMLVVSYLLVITDSLYHQLDDVLASKMAQEHPRELLCLKRAHLATRDAVRNQLVYAYAHKHVHEFTVDEVVKSLRLVALRWTTLRPDKALLDYLVGLVHRGALLMARPASAKLHDARRMRRPLKAGPATETSLFSGNYDLLRRLAGGATHMIMVTRFWLHAARPSAADLALFGDVHAGCDGVSRALQEGMQKMKKAASLSRELREMFNTSGIVFGDLDVFVEKCNADPARPMDVVFNTKPQDTQHAWMVLNQSIDCEALCRMREDRSPHYRQIYTYAQHLYSQDLKLYIAETYVKPGDCDLCIDYFLIEAEFPRRLNVLMAFDYPCIVRLFGRAHVVFERKLYECTGIEHAIYVWAKLIRHKRNGKINDICIDTVEMPCLGGLLGESIVFNASTGWAGRDVTDGDTSDF